MNEPLPWPRPRESAGPDLPSTDGAVAESAAREVAPPPPPPPADRLVRLAAAATALSRWFLAPPSASVLAELADPALLAEWPLAPAGWTPATSEPRGDATATGLAHLATVHDADAVAHDHARLFVGPGRLQAAPYESVHTSEEGLLFEAETLDVRAWYRHYGLSAPRVGREPDDHLGLELEFVATLATWALDALEAGRSEEAAVFAHGLRGFVEAHLAWLPAYTALLAERAETDFHRGLAHLTRGLHEALPDLLAPT